MSVCGVESSGWRHGWRRLRDEKSMSTPAERELAYYEDLYGGFAQQHFAKPAVAAFRRYLAARILAVCRQHCGATTNWRVLSLGCGIGDTELLIAPHVGEIVAIDLS